MGRSLALLLSSSLLLGAADSPPGAGASTDMGPMLVKVESMTPKPVFDGNVIEHWRQYRFRIVGATYGQLSRFKDNPERHVDVFDRRDVPPPGEGGGYSAPPACPGPAAGEQIYVVRLEKVRARKLLDGVQYVLESCLTYDPSTAYGFALFDDG